MPLAQNESPVPHSSVTEDVPVVSEADGSAEGPKNYFLVGTIKVPVFDAPKKSGRSYYTHSSRP